MWLISVPVWGRTYVKTFLESAWPSLKIALLELDRTVQLVIHTDSAEQIQPALNGFYAEFRPVAKAGYVALQLAHADAISSAKSGERVGLLNADIVVSRNLFARCEEHISAGAKAVVLSGVRTIPGADTVPVGAGSRDLLLWALDHRHTIIHDLEWGKGRSTLPSNLFFYRDGNAVLRGFHLHPVAILKDRPLNFISTIDGDLLNTFDRATIHVVTDPDDMSMLEISDPGKRFGVGAQTMSIPMVVAWARNKASPLHRWLFSHRIVLRGEAGDCGDMEVCRDILARLR